MVNVRFSLVDLFFRLFLAIQCTASLILFDVWNEINIIGYIVKTFQHDSLRNYSRDTVYRQNNYQYQEK